MRDFLLNEAVKRLALEAATRFSALIARGDQIPFDVAERPGPDSLFYSYRPLTDRYVLERESELARCPLSSRPAMRSGRPGSPLPIWRQRGEAVLGRPGERSARCS